MKLLTKRLTFLQDNYFNEWLTARQEAEQEVSDSQSMFCVCGRLATGLHERGCKRFNDKVTSRAVQKLEHLLNLKDKK
jgi:hypothetical protein